MITGWSEDKVVSLLPQLQFCYSLIFRNVLDTRFHLPGGTRQKRMEDMKYCRQVQKKNIQR